MANTCPGPARAARCGRVYVEGPPRLVTRLEPSLRRALGGRCEVYYVEVCGIGWRGDVMLRITHGHEHVSLLFDRDHLGPAHVRRTVERLPL